ncbi:MAG TPA: Wzy polymerase domain-containing protein [Burkholderiaceae bacterium]
MALLAIAGPALLAVNFPPSPTLVNQTLALAGWGGMVALVGTSSARHAAGCARHSLPLWLALGLLGLATLLSPAFGALPWGIGVTGLALVGAAGLVAWSICSLDGRHPDHEAAFAAFANGMVVAGLASAAIGMVQVFMPSLADGGWIATHVPGRATGNVRQPNHLASLLLWALIAVVWMRESGRLRLWQSIGVGAVLLFVVVLSASRTGLVGAVVLSLWGLLDRQLSSQTRRMLWAIPVFYAVAWWLLSAWAHHNPQAFAGEARLSHGGDLSSSRFAIWSNTLAMIRDQPWLGVGHGEFNFVWTLSEFARRPTAFFDHTHNLPLQLLVELGIPLGGAVMGLLLAALFQAWRRARSAQGHGGAARRAAFMMVLMIGLHSMLEYPLWYAYFLLPTAFAWGFVLSPASPEGAQTPAGLAPDAAHRNWIAVGAAMVVVAIAATWDYMRVVVIYDPPELAAPLEERIESGQRSPLFGHHADYAAATAFGEPKAPLSASQQLAFRRAPHQLLDVRLMIAWSQALAAQGELDKARWLAARIREFRNPGADEFFEPCSRPQQAAQAFQCQPPRRVVNWREFTEQR